MVAIGKFLIIKPIAEETVKKSGLMIPESLAKDIRYLKASVVSKGTDVDVVEDGDIIFYDKIAGHFINYEGESYKVIEERNIVLKV